MDLVLALTLHQLATIVWIGGMFFAHMALRPAAQEVLKPQLRLPLLRRVFARFFPWVWGSIAVLWGSGYWIFVGIHHGLMGHHVHAMMGVAAVMSLIFFYIFFGPYARLAAALEDEEWAAAGVALGGIRVLILINLILGLANAVIGTAGRGLLG